MPLYLVFRVTDHPDDSETREEVGEHRSLDSGLACARAEEHARNLASSDPAHAYDVAFVARRYVGKVTVEQVKAP